MRECPGGVGQVLPGRLPTRARNPVKWDYIYKEDPWIGVLVHIGSPRERRESIEIPNLSLTRYTGGGERRREPVVRWREPTSRQS